MRLLFIYLLLPITIVAQSVSEFQLISYDKVLVKEYDFRGSRDSLKSHAQKYQLISTNLGVNNGVSALINQYLTITGQDTVSKYSSTKWADKVILDFAQFESDTLKSPVILRKFGEGIKCDSCEASIFEILIEDEDVKDILEMSNIEWIYAPYFQISSYGQWQMSYVCFYYKEKRKKMSAILISLPNDVK